MSDTPQPGRIFVSHAGADRAWAEWAVWHLHAAGYATELDSIDWPAGTNFMAAMHRALARENPMLVLLSRAYLDPKRYTTDEWTARLAQRRRDPAARLIPVRIDDVPLTDGLWAPIVVPDVYALPPADAVTTLITAVRGAVPPQATAPSYPGEPDNVDPGPRPPGSLPPVWHLARRNPAFTGRDGMLNQLHDSLRTERRAAIQALHGMGGVGKTQLAIEYAHRFAGEYELVWWVTSEQPELIGEQLATLATATGIIPAGTHTPTAVGKLRAHLRGTTRWLVIFDNAENRDDLTPWLPDGAGHILITSRNPTWSGVAQTVSVDVFARAESTALIRANLPHLADADINRLAEALGDLPLAIAQAADLLAETAMPIQAYLTTLAEHAADLFTSDQFPAGYPQPLAAAVTMAADRLAADDPAARQLLTLCAYFAPEPIPLDLFTGPLPTEVAAVADSPLALARTAGRLTRYGLARTTPDGLQLHRLTQAILRDTDTGPHRAVVEQLLIDARPDDGTNPALWPRWSLLLPHILACDPATTDNTQLRWLTYDAGWYLLARGDARTALPLAEQLHTAWHQRHGPDDPTTIVASDLLAYAHRELGHYQQARNLHEDTLTRSRRLYGDDHPDTLASAHNLAIDLSGLGEHQQARELDEDTLARSRSLLGDEHPDTLNSANNLAADLRALGEHQQAHELDEDTLTRRRRTLGNDHPDTLKSANNLAADLSALGEHQQARQLDEDTLTRRRRLLGDDHPDTLDSAHNHAADLRQLGEHEEARRVEADAARWRAQRPAQ